MIEILKKSVQNQDMRLLIFWEIANPFPFAITVVKSFPLALAFTVLCGFPVRDVAEAFPYA